MICQYRAGRGHGGGIVCWRSGQVTARVVGPRAWAGFLHAPGTARARGLSRREPTSRMAVHYTATAVGCAACAALANTLAKRATASQSVYS
jgi:hypothetical protein